MTHHLDHFSLLIMSEALFMSIIIITDDVSVFIDICRDIVMGLKSVFDVSGSESFC